MVAIVFTVETVKISLDCIKNPDHHSMIRIIFIEG